MAIERFDRMWEVEGAKLLRADITPAGIKNGEIQPVDYCISTIARLSQQPNGYEMINRIRRDLADLFELAKGQFAYPDESLHVSLLGCTQRQGTDVFDDTQIKKIKDICSEEIKKKDSFKVNLKGVGIVGNQIFIQGIPMNHNWKDLRTSLDQRLTDSGEQPISYEDKSPIHMNIIRIVEASPGVLESLYEVISRLREIELGMMDLTTIELVITDFCVSKRRVTCLDKVMCHT